MSKHIYAVEHDHGNGITRGIGYVQASSKQEAKRTALANVVARRLDGAEIYDLHRRGIAIVDADSGNVVGREEGEQA